MKNRDFKMQERYKQKEYYPGNDGMTRAERIAIKKDIKIKKKFLMEQKNGRKKLTDEETVKALECCIPLETDCKECPLFDIKTAECIQILCKNALALINRQKAEIEKLNKEKQELQKFIERIG